MLRYSSLNMAELDHIFICTDVDAPAAQRLKDAGLTEGSGNVHPGQGSANRRFFFKNVMLELLWVHDLTEANSQPIDLGQRWQQRQVCCPFGICLRPSQGDATATPPFAFWHYHPPYLPPSLSIPVADNTGNLAEPMLFYLAFGTRPDQLPVDKQQPTDHAGSFSEVTRLGLTLTQAVSPSVGLQSLIDQALIDLEYGDRYGLTLGFDGEPQGQQVSFWPELPLVLSW